MQDNHRKRHRRGKPRGVRTNENEEDQEWIFCIIRTAARMQMLNTNTRNS